MKNKKIFGTLCGMLAAIFYGTNNFGAVNLGRLGMPTSSILFYRFGLALIIITLVLLMRRETFRVTRRELGTLIALGVLFTASSLSLYVAFRYMPSGVASTILFSYPVMTAAIMMLFFHEKFSFTTFSAIVLSVVGVVLLSWNKQGGPLSPIGVVLVLVSALSYAVYIIIMDRGKLEMSSFKINFYVLICCVVGMFCYSFVEGAPLQMPVGSEWFYVGWLAVVPAIFALTLMVYSAKIVGSTATAILGALEPLTAVLIGLLLFHEPFSVNLAFGIVLILGAVMIIALKKK